MTSLATLAAQGRALQLPASLALASGELQLEQCLRLLPGKRIVARARWQGCTVLAKVFFQQKNWQAENAGYQRLSNTQLQTPAQLLSVAHEQGGVCIYEFIDGAQGLDQLWQHFSAAQKHSSLSQLKTILQRLEQAELLQADLHLGNFLARGDQLWVIDPASVQTAKHTQAFQKNMALFIAQLPLGDRAQAIKALEIDAATQQAVDSMWQQRQQQYLKKIMRDCTDVAAASHGSTHYLCKRQYHAALQTLLQHPEQLAAAAQKPLLKDGNSAKVFIIDTDIGRLVVKQYINKDWLRKLRRALQSSRAKRSWLFSHAMQFAGIAVPEPIAVIERKTGPITQQSWFISREVIGEDLLSLWQRQAAQPDLLAQVKALALALGTSKISHGDMKATNFIVAEQQLFTIDYDGCRQHRKQAALTAALSKDWRRFRANWPDNTVLQRQLDQFLP